LTTAHKGKIFVGMFYRLNVMILWCRKGKR